MTIRNQFYCVDIENNTWVLVGRNEINQLGHPTGGYMAVPEEEQKAWIVQIGLDNLYLELPQQDPEN